MKQFLLLIFLFSATAVFSKEETALVVPENSTEKSTEAHAENTAANTETTSLNPTPTEKKSSLQFVGGLQHASLFPTVSVVDDRTSLRPDWAKIDHLSNTYLDMALRYTYHPSNRLGFTGFTAATRAELMLSPMLGYDADFQGYGIAHLHLDANFHWGTITIGDVYGQFGSGLILRLYEERSLGVDNALRGGKIVVNPYKGIHLEMLGGKQRRYWNCYTDGAWGYNYKQDALLGANLELNIEQWSPRMQDAGAVLLLGGSFVSKYDAIDTILVEHNNGNAMLNLPLWVGAGDLRANFQIKGWNALLEYAYKANDPSINNNYSYNHGEALLASLSYSRKGMAVFLQAKRSENMYFRSERQRLGNAGSINLLPVFANQHTYKLAAFNSYATQLDGEWAFQGEVRYTWKRGTKMGGKYGTTLKLNASHIRGLGENWFSMSKKPYYTDVNLELNKKINKQWYLGAMLMYQTYNKEVIEGHGHLIRSAIGVLDAKWATSKNVQMRAEFHYLFSRQDDGQWLFALYELSLFKQLMFTLSEQYCIGHAQNPTAEQGQHYYNFLATWQRGAHRLSLGYGKSIDGFDCSGGVCRYVPKEEGVSITYNFTW